MPPNDRWSQFQSLCAREPHWLVRLHTLVFATTNPRPDLRHRQARTRLLRQLFQFFDDLALQSRAVAAGQEECGATPGLASESSTVREPLPNWNTRRGVLTFVGVVLMRFERAAPLQRSILDAFQKANWPECIDNPVPEGDHGNRYEQMRTAIKGLNAHQCVPLLHFRANGQRGVRWEFAADPCLLEDLLLS